MATMDVFNQDAFQLVALTRGFEADLPFKPGLIRSLGIFSFRGLRLRSFAIEERDGKLTLIDFTDPDAPPTQENSNGEERRMRDFRTRHMKDHATVRASEIAGIRAFGTESEEMQVGAEVARKAQKLRNDAELTFEFHGLNALQGKVLQPSTGAVVYDWYTEFDIVPAAEIDFDLDNAAPAKGALRKKCFEVITAMEEDAGGLVPGDMQVEAVCGRDFWRDLTSHPEVMDAYYAAMKLGELSGKPQNSFEWGGIIWRRYRGGAGVGVNVDKCHLYPAGIDGLFEQYASPIETFDELQSGQPGKEFYYYTVPDRDTNKWVKLFIEANPMFICTRPKLLRTGRRT